MPSIDYDSVAEIYMAQSAGFRVVDLHGSYDGATYDPDKSPVMIWSLERGA